MTGNIPSKQDVLIKLGNKFEENLKKALSSDKALFERVDLKARGFAAVGQLLSENTLRDRHRQDLVLVFDEVFSDVTISVYLAASGLYVPAQSALRRSLELGFAIVFLWDSPPDFWAWKSHDTDLNFKNMLDCLSKDCYKTFLRSLIPGHMTTIENVFDQRIANELYRTLSNTIHGKITTHVAYLPDRFVHSTLAWHSHLEMAEKTLDVLLGLARSRFPSIVLEVTNRVPGIAN